MPDYFVHPSSYIDPNVSIGSGTKIWFFCFFIVRNTHGIHVPKYVKKIAFINPKIPSHSKWFPPYT